MDMDKLYSSLAYELAAGITQIRRSPDKPSADSFVRCLVNQNEAPCRTALGVLVEYKRFARSQRHLTDLVEFEFLTRPGHRKVVDIDLAL